jgi:hypothetical protein
MPLVHCINLPHRTDRKISAQKQAADQGFRIQFWDGITDSKKNFTNISRAHKQIVARAKQAKIPAVCIMEDDCIFTHPEAFKYFLSKKPKYYHLYMGLIYAGTINENQQVLSAFSGGMTLYYIHQTFYDIFLSADEEDHIDRWCGKQARANPGRLKFYVCDPMVVKQSGGYSDNFRSFKQYSDYEQSIRFYNGGT